MAVSTQPAAKAALVALLQSAFDGTGVAVSYGHPGRFIEDRHAWVGDTDDESEQEWSSTGAMRREEAYAFRLVFSSSRPGQSQQEATEDAFWMAGAAEQVLRDNVRLGTPAVVRVAEVKALRFEEYVNGDEGFACAVTGGVRCKASLPRA